MWKRLFLTIVVIISVATPSQDVDARPKTAAAKACPPKC
jgi:hypothetical protein